MSTLLSSHHSAICLILKILGVKGGVAAKADKGQSLVVLLIVFLVVSESSALCLALNCRLCSVARYQLVCNSRQACDDHAKGHSTRSSHPWRACLSSFTRVWPTQVCGGFPSDLLCDQANPWQFLKIGLLHEQLMWSAAVPSTRFEK